MRNFALPNKSRAILQLCRYRNCVVGDDNGQDASLFNSKNCMFRNKEVYTLGWW